MQCENGYTKDGVRGILCREAEEPKDGDLGSVAHALCGHQRFCPNERCFMFLPSWESCTKRRVKPVEAAETQREPETGKSAAKKKRTQKASE